MNLTERQPLQTAQIITGPSEQSLANSLRERDSEEQRTKVVFIIDIGGVGHEVFGFIDMMEYAPEATLLIHGNGHINDRLFFDFEAIYPTKNISSGVFKILT